MTLYYHRRCNTSRIFLTSIAIKLNFITLAIIKLVAYNTSRSKLRKESGSNE